MSEQDPFKEARCRTAYDWSNFEVPFFEQYENETSGKSNIRNTVDAMCLACPVRKDCFKLGAVTKSTGVFGGWFLLDGKISESKNSHKPAYIKEALKVE